MNGCSVEDSSINQSEGSINRSSSETIALGTSSGSVLIFSLRTGDVSNHFSNDSGHTGRVNDIAWDVGGNGELYSCSDDGTVRHFHARRSAVISQFRPGGASSKSPGGAKVHDRLHSVCLHPSGGSLLVGSVSRIFWVDLDTKATLKVFEGGHVGPVTSLLALTGSLSGCCYLLSAGSANSNDQTISLWDLSLEEDKEGSQLQGRSSLKFSVGENVVSLFSSQENQQPLPLPQTPNQLQKKGHKGDGGCKSIVTFGAVTKSGALLRYQHDLSFSKQKKPVKPSSTLQIASGQSKGSNGSSPVVNVPILGARFVSHQDHGESAAKNLKNNHNDSNNNSNVDLQIAYGNYLQPSFEVLQCQALNKLTCLVRDVVPQLRNGHASAIPEGSSSSVKERSKSLLASTTNTTLVVPETSGAKVIAPGPSMVSDIPANPATSTKRKQPGAGTADSLSMSDRLRLLTSETHHKTTPPRTDSMCNLLLQGLNNRDRKILDSVLDRADEELIENTVRKLPFEAVVPLITELQHYIKGRGMVNQAHAKWLRTTLQIHAAHLMSTPDCDKLLGPIYGMLEARTRHFSAVLQLKGKLDMMTRQITARPEDTVAAASTIASTRQQDALLVYHDDSSDDLTEAIDDLLLPTSDAEDNWDLEDDKIEVDEDDDEEDEDEDDDDDDEDSDVEEVGVDSDDDIISDDDDDLVNGEGPPSSNGKNHKDIEMDSD